MTHRIPYELSGLATLLVEYLSLLGEEMELFHVLMSTLLAGLLLDAQGILSGLLLYIYGFIVFVEFAAVVFVALRRHSLERSLFEAVERAREVKK